MTEHTDTPGKTPHEELAQWAARGLMMDEIVSSFHNQGAAGEEWTVEIRLDPDPRTRAEELIAEVRREAFREAAAKLRDAAEQGYRPNTARYTHYREAADMLDGMAGQ